MRNKPQQLSTYAKKLLKEQDNQIQNLSSQLNKWKEFNDQLQEDYRAFKALSDEYSDKYYELKSMNLFQLILWWIKK